MNTLLPSPDYLESAACLDTARLSKQIMECYQLLNAIHRNGGWSHHRVTKMWRDHSPSLLCYAAACHHEYKKRRGRQHQSFTRIVENYGDLILNHCDRPAWRGDEAFHSSHRARLLQKGRIDVLRKRLAIFKKRKGISDIDHWVNGALAPMKKIVIRDLTVRHTDRMIECMDINEIPNFPNWYDQHGWAEQPGDDYAWPILPVR